MVLWRFIKLDWWGGSAAGIGVTLKPMPPAMGWGMLEELHTPMWLSTIVPWLCMMYAVQALRHPYSSVTKSHGEMERSVASTLRKQE